MGKRKGEEDSERERETKMRKRILAKVTHLRGSEATGTGLLIFKRASVKRFSFQGSNV